MLRDIYEKLYDVTAGNFLKAEGKDLPFEKSEGLYALGQTGNTVDVRDFYGQAPQTFLQTAYCRFLYRPADQEKIAAASVLAKELSPERYRKRLLRQIKCSQVSEFSGMQIKGLPLRSTVFISVWQVLYKAYHFVVRYIPAIEGVKECSKRILRY